MSARRWDRLPVSAAHLARALRARALAPTQPKRNSLSGRSGCRSSPGAPGTRTAARCRRADRDVAGDVQEAARDDAPSGVAGAARRRRVAALRRDLFSEIDQRSPPSSLLTRKLAPSAAGSRRGPRSRPLRRGHAEAPRVKPGSVRLRDAAGAAAVRRRALAPSRPPRPRRPAAGRSSPGSDEIGDRPLVSRSAAGRRRRRRSRRCSAGGRRCSAATACRSSPRPGTTRSRRPSAATDVAGDVDSAAG